MSAEATPDNARRRAFVADVQAVIAGSFSPRAACEALTPRFAELLADPTAALEPGRRCCYSSQATLT